MRKGGVRYFLLTFIFTLLSNLSLTPFNSAYSLTETNLKVTNTIYASFINPLSGKRAYIFSNTISIKLLPVANTHLNSNIQKTVSAGQQLQLPHQLTNFGNIPDSYALTLLDSADNDANLQNLALYHDANANAKLDDGESQISQLSNIAPEQKIHLLIVGTVPQNVTQGMLISLKLSATSLNTASLGTKLAINIDSLEVNDKQKKQRESNIDMTLDQAIFEQNLAISKQASTSSAMLGDIIHYTIHLGNQTGKPLYKLQLHDVFPQGLKLLEQTIQLNGKKYANIILQTPSKTVFELGYFEKNQELILSYSARISATVATDNIINQAYLVANSDSSQLLKSKTASAEVKINNQETFSNKGTLFGKVHFDKRCGYQKTPKNALLAIGGVRLYLETGQYAVTDAAGDYSFNDLEAELHVVKIDPISLPEGVHLTLSDNRQVKDPRSYLINLKKNNFSRADFIIDCINSKNKKTILAEIKKHNSTLSDSDYLEKYNTANNLHPLLNNKQALFSPEKMLISKEMVKTITNQQAKKGAWLWPKKNISSDGRFMAVVRSDVRKPVLLLNGNTIAEEQLGEQISNRKARGQILTWYGIKLKKGKNTLEIKGVDRRGKMLSLLKKEFIQPSRGVKIHIEPLKKVLVADGGKSTLALKITILDQQGYPAIGDYFLTIASSDGTWVEPDLQSLSAGHQVKINNGQGEIHLRSSRKTGEIRISVKADELKGETKIAQTAYLRPLFVTGYINLTAGTEGARDARSKLFMQGKILKDTHITLSFDSDKQYDPEHSAFSKEIEDHFYPLKGDASQQGKKARSRNKLFIKLEKGQQNILYGDYQTKSFADNDLAQVQRSLTGIQSNLEFGKTKIQAHIAQEQDLNVVEEFRGNGTASNYQLKNKHLITNSEIVELIIRDKNNRGIIWYNEALKPISDYTLDTVTGYLSFHRVIPSFDDKLNPVFIRISYNQASDGKKHLVAGANIKHKLSDALTIGTSVNIDKNKDNGNQLGGANLKYTDKDGSHFSLSVARMRHNKSNESGNAYQIKANKKWSGDKTTNLSISRADKHFSNPTGNIVSDRQEIKLTHRQKINKSTQIKAEAQQSKALSTNKQQQSIATTVETRNGKWLLEGGVRHIQNQKDGNTEKFNTVMASAKRSMQVLGKSARLGASYEQDIANSQNHHATVSADLAVTNDTSLYARYKSGKELLKSLDNVDASHTNTLVVGVKNKLTPKLETYSEYRTKLLSGNNSGETAAGLRGVIPIEKGLAVTPTLEVVKVTKGAVLNDALSASVKIKDVRDADNKKYLHLETRQSKNSDYYAIDGNYIKRLDDVWSGFIGEELHITKPKGKNANGSHTLTLGLAQRQRDDGKHNSRYLYQWKEEYSNGASNNKDGNNSTHVLSTQQNYKLNEDISISGHVAGKWQTNTIDNKKYHNDTMLMDAKANYAINDKVDIFARAGVIGSDHFKQQQYSTGLGANISLDKNLRVGVAYNKTGFKDKDLDPNKQNKDGFFINLTLKADEDMFDWLNRKKKKKTIEKIDIPKPKTSISYQPQVIKQTKIKVKSIPKSKKATPRRHIKKVLSGSSNFAMGSADLNFIGRQIIDTLAQELRQSGLQKMHILVIGHTDNIGSDIDNQILSEHRAESVALYLSQLGLDLMKMDVEGRGESQPIANNQTKAGRASNRRVNIFINGISQK